MDKNEKPLRITEEAARDMWAAACGIAKQEVDFDVAPQVNGYLPEALLSHMPGAVDLSWEEKAYRCRFS